MIRLLSRKLLAISPLLFVSACSAPQSEIFAVETPERQDAPTVEAVSTAHIKIAEAMPDVWMTYGGGYDEQRHSNLTVINKENIKQLGVAWTYDFQTARGVEATPIVVDGVMYVTGAWSIVYALDAQTGEEIWTYNPQVAGEVAAKGCCGVVNRGVAIYEGKVLVGVYDGRLEALDAKTGKLLWSTVTVDQSKPYTITGAPRAVDGKVLIGNGGAEQGVRGYLSAYDADSGALVWRFYTAPNPEKKPDGAASDEIFSKLANQSWGDSGAWKTDGGGGTVWDSIIYDAENDSVIFGVGNGSPWNDDVRDPVGKGDNLFLSSIVAVDADSGNYKWHFQTTPREKWDFTATQSLILADLPFGEDGAMRRVVMQAPKNGFFYVLDAATGEFLSGEAFAEDMTWANGLDEKGRPIEDPEVRSRGKKFLVAPGPMGAHNWHPMAYSPRTRLAYIPAQEIARQFKNNPDTTTRSLWNIGYDVSDDVPLDPPNIKLTLAKRMVSGKLLAWDPVKQEARWEVEHGEIASGGVLSTASDIVFQGTRSGEFSAYDALNGTLLWSRGVNNGIAAAPITYEVNGDQYVAIATGWGGLWALTGGLDWDKKVAPSIGRMVVFKLNGKGQIPEAMERFVEPTPKAEPFGTEALRLAGLKHYTENCMSCHGPFGISSGVTPDLRWSHVSADKDTWHSVVMEGVLKDRGMISFTSNITPEESEAIRAYVLYQADIADNCRTPFVCDVLR